MIDASPNARRFRAAGALLGAIAALALSGAGAHAWEAPQPFHFRNTPYMIAWQARVAAADFVASHVRPGAPMWAAMKAAIAADARCRVQKDNPNAPIVCTYGYFVNPPDGDLGEAEWRLVITPRQDGSGTVGSALLTHEHYGL